MSTEILIIGGAGYIGSHMVRYLQEKGFSSVVLDNLSSGNRSAVGSAELVEGDIGDAALLGRLFSEKRFACVMHFASSIQVGESVTDPGKYYDNNVARTVTLLNALVKHNIGCFIFSSTAAIFGNPDYSPIDERHPARPVNPYGRSKLIVENMLADYHRAYGLKYGALRYFNAAGAMPDASIGECHEPETHLIPLVLQAASGKRPSISIYGNDYPTPDGTCVRDYIHVNDLAEAHFLLWKKLEGGMQSAAFNLGTGKGYSVKEVIDAAQNITGKSISVQQAARRPGDPATLIADGAAARRELNWKPKSSDLETIIRHAWQWEQTHPR